MTANQAVAKNVLLIGAGFSKNFGGYLAEEVYLKIFNHADLTEKLKHHLLIYSDNCDYEGFCEDILNQGVTSFTEEEKNITKDVLIEVYTDMDKKTQLNFNGNSNFSYLRTISFLINRFSFSNNGSGYIFSLNHDLLLERLFADFLKSKNFYQPGGWGEYLGALLPHLGPVNSPLYKYHKDDLRAAQPFDRLEQATEQGIREWREKHENTYENENRKIPCLVKLHGSFYWRENQSNAIWVVGTQSKERIIKSNPILNFYWEKFGKILEEPKVLYVIGYSFRDPHINKIVAESCQNGTRLIIFDIVPFKIWLEQIRSEFKKFDYNFDTNWLKQYHKASFQDLFLK